MTCLLFECHIQVYFVFDSFSCDTNVSVWIYSCDISVSECVIYSCDISVSECVIDSCDISVSV